MAVDSNAKQSIPTLFVEIMTVQEEMNNLLWAMAKDGITHAKARQFRELKTRNQELIRAAEKALRWNTDKGN